MIIMMMSMGGLTRAYGIPHHISNLMMYVIRETTGSTIEPDIVLMHNNDFD
jgi:hypothetical protein